MLRAADFLSGRTSSWPARRSPRSPSRRSPRGQPAPRRAARAPAVRTRTTAARGGHARARRRGEMRRAGSSRGQPLRRCPARPTSAVARRHPHAHRAARLTRCSTPWSPAGGGEVSTPPPGQLLGHVDASGLVRHRLDAAGGYQAPAVRAGRAPLSQLELTPHALAAAIILPGLADERNTQFPLKGGCAEAPKGSLQRNTPVGRMRCMARIRHKARSSPMLFVRPGTGSLGPFAQVIRAAGQIKTRRIGGFRK